MFNDFSLSVVPFFGVVQGPVLGLILFLLYMVPVDQLISSHNAHFHF